MALQENLIKQRDAFESRCNTLESTISALRSEVEGQGDALLVSSNMLTSREREISHLRAGLEKMQKLLRKQGHHSASCNAYLWHKDPVVDARECDCGLAAAIAAKARGGDDDLR